MRIVKSLWIGCLSFSAAACMSSQDPEQAVAVASASAALTWTDQGTTLTVDTEIEPPRCDGTRILLGVSGRLVSTGAASAVVMVETIDGKTTEQTIVNPTDFVHLGRNKVADFMADVAMSSGTHAVQLCFAQSGAKGRSSKQACLNQVTVSRTCALPPPPPPDTTPPTITASRSPLPNAAGWTTSDVVVSFACSDAQSGVASCSAPVTLRNEGRNQAATGVAVDRAGNRAQATASGVNIDKTAPSISALRSAAPNEHGWNNSAVTVSFSCSDALSGVASCAPAVSFTSEGAGLFARGSAADMAGNGAQASEGEIRIDRTAPSVGFTGARAYFVDEVVDVHCTFTDALSGIGWSSCGDEHGDAYGFELGSHEVGGDAMDRAGNDATASAAFSVHVNAESLCRLMERFSSKPGVAGALCVKVTNAAAVAQRGNANTANNMLDAFGHQLSAQTGKAFTAPQAAILSRLVNALRP